jgi:hypothetical protein
MAKTMVKLRAFLDAEAKRHSGSNGIKPTEPVPMKILKPTRYSLYTRLCPFCRKARGKIQSVSRKQFEGTCPNCGASGPKHEKEQLARRAWNGGNE